VSANTLPRRRGTASPAHNTRTYRHPVNQAVFEAAPLGARVADRVTGFMGSWRFIVIQTVIVAVWLASNIVLLSRPFDPFPFILLNLAFSTQAAYAAPLILLAGNRASQRDRLTLEHAATEGDLGDAQNERLLAGNTEILKQVAALEARILIMENTILAALMTGRRDQGDRRQLSALTSPAIAGGRSPHRPDPCDSPGRRRPT
jgi:uncharacterized membrane protein